MISTDSRPYIGLRHFEEGDANLFYGRDEHIVELLGRLAENRFVAVLGSSGCGKSSLVRAGLLPELRSGMIPKAGSRWKVVEFQPGRSPLGELAESLHSKLGVEKARELVEEGPLGIALVVAGAKLDGVTNVLVIADQFEEVFRFQREESVQNRGSQAAEECQALVRRLLDAAAQTELPIYVLLVMRSDYLGECAEFPDLPEQMSKSLYLVPRLRRDQLQDVITAPIGGSIEPSLVQRLLGELGNNPDQLPRLQHLLCRMWERAAGGRLTLAHYTESGGWGKALEQHLEEVYGNLDDLQQDVCKRVFQQLSDIDRGRAVRRRADLKELIVACGPHAGVIAAKFREAGFLTPREDPVEVMHECILREWPLLREWQKSEERDARRLSDLAQAAKDAGWPFAHDKQPEALRGLEGLTLQNLAAWRDQVQPTAGWARRYQTAVDFETADGYLAWSRDRDQQQKREARARELMANAALAQTEDPALALYLGWRAAQIGLPLPRGLEAVLATALTNGPSYAVLRAHNDAVGDVGWSPDGKTIASVSDDGTIKLWEAVNGQLLRTLGSHLGYVRSVAWNPDGRTLASSGSEGTILLWDSASGQQFQVLKGHSRTVNNIAWSPDGKTLASVGNDRGIRLWDAARGRLVRILQGHEEAVHGAAWSPDSKTLASASGDRTIRLWDAVTGQQRATLKGHQDGVRSVAWSPNGKTLVSASADRAIRLWDAVSGRILRTLRGHQDGVRSVTWSPDGRTLASASFDRTIRTWDAGSGQPLRTLQGHQGAVNGVAWSPDGETLVSASWDHTVRLWRPADGQPLRILEGHQDGVRCVAWNQNGRILASASFEGTVGLWEPVGSRPLRILQGHHGAVLSVAWSPDGTALASSGTDQRIRLWDTSGRLFGTLEGHQGAINSVAWSPDGKILASASADQTIREWDWPAGRLFRALEGHRGIVNNVAWSPDGKTLVSASTDRTIRLWEAQGGQLLRVLEGNQDIVNSVAFSPDGKTLASTGLDGTVSLWEEDSSRPIRILRGHQGAANSVAWSPDGTSLVSTSNDGTIRLWDAVNGQALRTLQGHQGVVRSVAWNPDGKTLASGGADRTIRLWPGTPVGLIEQAGHSIRHYTPSPGECQRYFASDDCQAIQ